MIPHDGSLIKVFFLSLIIWVQFKASVSFPGRLFDPINKKLFMQSRNLNERKPDEMTDPHSVIMKEDETKGS